jgi:hypothetical protein
MNPPVSAALCKAATEVEIAGFFSLRLIKNEHSGPSHLIL